MRSAAGAPPAGREDLHPPPQRSLSVTTARPRSRREGGERRRRLHGRGSAGPRRAAAGEPGPGLGGAAAAGAAACPCRCGPGRGLWHPQAKRWVSACPPPHPHPDNNPPQGHLRAPQKHPGLPGERGPPGGCWRAMEGLRGAVGQAKAQRRAGTAGRHGQGPPTAVPPQHVQRWRGQFYLSRCFTGRGFSSALPGTRTPLALRGEPAQARLGMEVS